VNGELAFGSLWTAYDAEVTARMTEAAKKVREYLAEIGKRGGIANRRELTRAHAKKMVAIREAKRAAQRAGKPLPPRDRRLLKLS